jgi:sulfur relay (sulfurtransferase) DsrC/TusE family protein
MGMDLLEAADLIEELDNNIKELKEIEKKGREIAKDKEGLIKEDAWSSEASIALENAKDIMELLIGKTKLFDKYKSFSDSFEQALNPKILKKAVACRLSNVKKKDCILEENPFTLVDQKSEELFGTRCTLMAGEVPPEKYDLSSAMNDAISCFSKTIGFLEGYSKNQKKIISKKVTEWFLENL